MKPQSLLKKVQMQGATEASTAVYGLVNEERSRPSNVADGSLSTGSQARFTAKGATEGVAKGVVKGIKNIAIDWFLPWLITAIPAGFAGGTTLGTSPINWIAYGDLRSKIEPCGCNPETDLGGIQRLSVVVEDLRTTQSAPLVVFGLGNDLPEVYENGSQDDQETNRQTVLGFLQNLNPDAVLFNVLEQKHLSWLDTWRHEIHPAKPQRVMPPYVLSQSIEKIRRPAWLSYSLKVGNYRIFGYVDQGHTDFKSEGTRWKREISDLKTEEQVVLLYSGSDEVLASIKSMQVFDLVITSNQVQLGTQPDQKEKSEPGRLLRPTGDYMVPSFGQGILTSHLLNQEPDLGALSKSSCSPVVAGLNCSPHGLPVLNDIQKPIIWLDRSFQRPSQLDRVLEDYALAEQSKFRMGANERKKALNTSKFAGAHACASCHVSAYKVWSESRHATALETLKAKIRHEHHECVSCHVLGLDEPGGYVDEMHTPHFAGVQCETCHGAAKAHTLDPMNAKPEIAQAAIRCESCHQTPHTSNFDRNKYWPKIKHSH